MARPASALAQTIISPLITVKVTAQLCRLPVLFVVIVPPRF